jgi:hypothetical protein
LRPGGGRISNRGTPSDPARARQRPLWSIVERWNASAAIATLCLHPRPKPTGAPPAVEPSSHAPSLPPPYNAPRLRRKSIIAASCCRAVTPWAASSLRSRACRGREALLAIDCASQIRNTQQGSPSSSAPISASVANGLRRFGFNEQHRGGNCAMLSHGEMPDPKPEKVRIKRQDSPRPHRARGRNGLDGR